MHFLAFRSPARRARPAPARLLALVTWSCITACSPKMPAESGTVSLNNATRAEARAVVNDFVSQMKPLLQSSIQKHGAAGAIDTCAVAAPRLADTLSAASGWQISRVSDKPRNVERAIADAWEREILQTFTGRLEAGEAPPAVNHGDVVDGEYRYMQAQVVDGVCLLCHGSSIAGDVASALAARYPQDRATGYRLGELRGAISLRRAAD